MQKLVSIITPSYNCGKYIHRLLDSVLNQTYKNIEMFVVDDGSTDGTRDVIEQYIEKFSKTGKKLQYIYKENGGAVSAINTGLKFISGEYFTWPDADDWYAVDDAIEQLVYIFEHSPVDIGFVRGLIYIIDEDTLNVIGKKGDESKEYPDNLFEQCIIHSSEWWFGAGSYMIKTEHLFDNYSDKSIYSPSIEGYGGGQNYPLLIPSLYSYRSITIKKYIYNILRRKSSLSRKHYSYEDRISKRFDFLEDMQKNTLLSFKKMTIDDKERYIKCVKTKYDVKRFFLAFSNKHRKDCFIYYNKILSGDKVKGKNHKMKYLFSQIPLGFIIFKCVSFFVNLPRRTANFLKQKICL